jgi:hypothetical protein
MIRASFSLPKGDTRKEYRALDYFLFLKEQIKDIILKLPADIDLARPTLLPQTGGCQSPRR